LFYARLQLQQTAKASRPCRNYSAGMFVPSFAEFLAFVSQSSASLGQTRRPQSSTAGEEIIALLVGRTRTEADEIAQRVVAGVASRRTNEFALHDLFGGSRG
jgi:hypothetical protein